MRSRAAILFLILTCLGLCPDVRSSDQNATPGTLPQFNAVISHIAVRSTPDAVIVEITSSKLVSPEIQTLSNPERLVFDFPACQLLHPSENIAVNRGPVLAVRASAFRLDPPTARVVVDLKEPRKFEMQYSGNTLRIKISAAGDAAMLPGAAKVDRTIPEQPKSASPQPSPRKAGHPSNSQQHAYGLLAKARTLTVSDLQPLEDRAEAGDPEAETTLALAYHAGVLLKADDEQALRLLHKAADKKFVGAEEALGIFHEMGFGMPPNAPEALVWYTKAAEHGSIDAATSIGLMYATGRGVPKDQARALQWFRRAAEAGDATAQLNLAGIYHRGEGVPRDDKEAVRWLTRAAEQNFIPAMMELAKMNMGPPGTPTDINAAIHWFERAAELGDGVAQAKLGEIFAEGFGVQPDYEKAVQWFRKAAEQGQPEGEFGLAARYWLGQGVPADPEQAWHWFTLAANQGHAGAQYNLGVMYERGQGVTADLQIAIGYYEKAADQGVAEAQYRLGRLLARGDASQPDKVSAYKWLVLAQDKVKESANAIAELKQSMSPSEIAEAQQQADAWRANHTRQPAGR